MGGGAPIVVQSMTNTDTADVEATARADGRALPRRVGDRAGDRRPRRGRRRRAAYPRPPRSDGRSTCRSSATSTITATPCLPIIPACAEALAKYRINPGNVGFKEKQDRNFSAMIDTALRFAKPVRIGVNWGSLDQALLTRLMDENASVADAAAARADHA